MFNKTMFDPILEHQRLKREQKQREQDAILSAIQKAHERYTRVEARKVNLDELGELETCAHDTWEDLHGRISTKNTETIGLSD